jgi:hypothetical protein
MNGLGKVSVSSEIQFSPPLRVALYIGINVGVFLLMLIGTAVSSPTNPRFLYVILITALCSSPILKLERINGPYFLLGVYLAFFYIFFGFGDLMLTLAGRTPEVDQGPLSETEAVILVSGIGLLVGYHAAVRAAKRKMQIQSVLVKDWSFLAVVTVGLLFWIAGTGALTYWQVYVIGDRSNTTYLKNVEALGTGLTTLFMLGQLVQPLGIMILAFAYTAYRRKFLLPLILTVVFVQVVLGFAADYKSEAMSAGILLVITKTYVDGKVPKSWLIFVGLFVVVVFPIFQAYRLEVRGEQGVSSGAALQNLLGTLERAIAAEDKVNSGFGGAEYHVQSAWERASLKASVELIVQKTGTQTPYQMGATLTPILQAFIPRILWSDKEGLAVGQIFNKTFHISVVEDVYISPSHVGEVYWNFGWLGTLIIMPATGFLLGFIGVRCTAYPAVTLTKLMIMIVTIVSFAVRAEGSIATEYVVWLRAVALIWLLNLILARPYAATPLSSGNKAAGSRSLVPVTPFENLLR